MKDIFELHLLKTLLFNFYYLPLKSAVKLPIRVYRGVKIGSLGEHDSVVIKDVNKRIHIGKKGSFGIEHRTYWNVAKDTKVVFPGAAVLCSATQIISNGELDFGDNNYCNSNCLINAGRKISFGRDVLIGWEVTIMDGDGHYIGKDGQCFDKYGSITIHDHVWIAAYAKILKNSDIPSNSVVGLNALVSKRFQEEALLIGGINKVLKNQIEWRK